MDADVWDEMFLPHHRNYVLVESWDAFKASSSNIIRYSCVKTMIPPFSPPNLTTNTQACDAFIQVSSGANYEEINNISRHTVAPIELKVTRTDNHMVVLWENGTQQLSRIIILQAAAHDAVRKRTVTLIQEMKK